MGKSVIRGILGLCLVALVAACASSPPAPGKATGQRVVRGPDGQRTIIPTRAPYFPTISVRNLNGEAVQLPRALPASRSVVVVAFEQNQADELEAWVNAMGARARALPWVGIAAPAPGLEFLSGTITSQLAANVPSRSDRNRIYTYYDRNRLLAGLQIRTAREPIIVVATQDGDVVTIVTGGPTTEKLRKLQSALH